MPQNAKLPTLPELSVFADAETMIASLAEALQQLYAQAVAQAANTGTAPHLVLTGGSTGAGVADALLAGLATVNIWQQVHFWFGDERFLPTGDAERNDTLFAEFFHRAGVPEDHIHRVPGPEEAADVHQAARSYAAELTQFFPTLNPSASSGPLCTLVGVGPDGHIASLFPDHPACQATGWAVAVTDSPKPPPQRVSLTREMLNSSTNLWAATAGAAKAGALALARQQQQHSTGTATTTEGTTAAQGGGQDTLPVGFAYGQQSTRWWLDEAAAAQF